jgi:hypothetical protein
MRSVRWRNLAAWSEWGRFIQEEETEEEETDPY